MNPKQPLISPCARLLSLPIHLVVRRRRYEVHGEGPPPRRRVGTAEGRPGEPVRPGGGGPCQPPLPAPVELGMMLAAAPRPPRQSFALGPSTGLLGGRGGVDRGRRARSRCRSCRPGPSRAGRGSSSCRGVGNGVQPKVYSWWFTPHGRTSGVHSRARITTFSAPASRCLEAFSTVVKTPVDSTTWVAPASAKVSEGHAGSSRQSRRPATWRCAPVEVHVSRVPPCTVSYLNMATM